jgi:hypothetical protein
LISELADIDDHSLALGILSLHLAELVAAIGGEAAALHLDHLPAELYLGRPVEFSRFPGLALLDGFLARGGQRSVIYPL